jgi:hypothetical protein
MSSSLVDFPFSFSVDHHGPPMVIGTSSYNPDRIIEYHPIKAFYVRPHLDMTYCLDSLFEKYNSICPEPQSFDQIKHIVPTLLPIDDLTNDEVCMILHWYEQLSRKSVYDKPFILMQRFPPYDHRVCGMIHVNGLIDYVQHSGGTESLKIEPYGHPALPLWINDVNYTPTYYTPHWAYRDIIDIDTFCKWIKKYIVV